MSREKIKTEKPRSSKPALKKKRAADSHEEKSPPGGNTAVSPSTLQQKLGNARVGRMLSNVQAKLTVGAANDPYEQEADRVARQVVDQPGRGSRETIQRMATDERKEDETLSPKLQRVAAEGEEEEKKVAPKLQRMATASQDEEDVAPKLQRKGADVVEDDEKQTAVQPKQQAGAAAQAPPGVESGIKQARGKGQPLSEQVREPMQNALGTDFSDVNIHTDARSDQLNEAIHARAFTTGKDIFFKQGEYNPDSARGKELLAHELTHVVQQTATKKNVRKTPQIQRLAPEDVAQEMVGKQFRLADKLVFGENSFAKGTIVTITRWRNDDASVTATAAHNGRSHTIVVSKNLIRPVRDTSAGLAPYHTGLERQAGKIVKVDQKIKALEKTITDWKGKQAQYKTEKGKKEWERQLKVHEANLRELKYTQTGKGYEGVGVPERLKKNVPRLPTLNKMLIQETMYNTFDKSIVKWTNHYNNKFKSEFKDDPLDANIVKSMVFHETGMGTRGRYMHITPAHDSDIMTRFNLLQAVDSYGPQQTIMIKEINPAIARKHKLDDVTRDLGNAKKRVAELKRKSTLTSAEARELAEIDRRTMRGTKRHWVKFYWTDSRWRGAVREFFLETAAASKARNLDYDYWIRTGIRWLFYKRRKEAKTSWQDAVRAFNGSGPDAVKYRKNVMKRAEAAKKAQKAKKTFVPKRNY